MLPGSHAFTTDPSKSHCLLLLRQLQHQRRPVVNTMTRENVSKRPNFVQHIHRIVPFLRHEIETYRRRRNSLFIVILSIVSFGT